MTTVSCFTVHIIFPKEGMRRKKGERMEKPNGTFLFKGPVCDIEMVLLVGKGIKESISAT